MSRHWCWYYRTTIATGRLGNATDYCCQCFVDIYEQHFEKFSSHAYIEVAVSALPLRDARKLASKNSKRQVLVLKIIGHPARKAVKFSGNRPQNCETPSTLNLRMDARG